MEQLQLSGSELLHRLAGKLRDLKVTGERLPPSMLQLLSIIEQAERRLRADDKPAGHRSIRARKR
jgi:hypothetical protein